eukprot:4447158-Pleurochrysis_carterae.AAC.2
MLRKVASKFSNGHSPRAEALEHTNVKPKETNVCKNAHGLASVETHTHYHVHSATDTIFPQGCPHACPNSRQQLRPRASLRPCPSCASCQQPQPCPRPAPVYSHVDRRQHPAPARPTRKVSKANPSPAPCRRRMCVLKCRMHRNDTRVTPRQPLTTRREHSRERTISMMRLPTASVSASN